MSNWTLKKKAKRTMALWIVLYILCYIITYVVLYLEVGADLRMTTTLCPPLYVTLASILVVLLPLGLRTAYLAKVAEERKLHKISLAVCYLMIVAAVSLGIIMSLEALGVIHL